MNDDRTFKGFDKFNLADTGEVSMTLNQGNGDKTPMVYAVGMGGGKSSCHTAKEVSPTLDCAHYGAPAIARSYGINPQSSLMYPCDEEVAQVLTVCHQSGVIKK